MKVQDEMSSQVISTKHMRKNFSKFFQKTKRKKHSQNLSMNNHHPNVKPQKMYYQNRELQANYCCSVAQSCPTVCDPMDCSTPGFPVLHHLPQLAQTLPLNWSCHPTISFSVFLFSSCLQCFPASRSFQISQFFTPGGQTIGASASHQSFQ